ncbi:GNAT family N-acetyltransferase [Afifella pfennigii]|uniref:GNAT family N-acetyltransferase n=1 Tax=Afifella pfennigii TaxID=209897 RepID=UPI00069240A3|nr:GNAT family N-acetyltransferase [Afifella pfennigii]
MTIDIRRAGEADIDLLLPLFLEMQRHYVGAAAIGSESARPRLLAALRPIEGRAILLASEANDALGFTCLYEMFPGADLDPAWFLKELYVTAAARGRKVGEALTREAARLAMRNGASRLDLTTGSGEDNEPVRRFYGRLGMDLVDKVYFRAEGAALEALAQEEDQA